MTPAFWAWRGFLGVTLYTAEGGSVAFSQEPFLELLLAPIPLFPYACSTYSLPRCLGSVPLPALRRLGGLPGELRGAGGAHLCFSGFPARWGNAFMWT